MINFLTNLRIIFHNHKFFKKNKIKNKNDIILLEFNKLASSIISYSYLSNVLKKKFDANIYAYRITAKKNLLKDFLWKLLSKIYLLSTCQIYKSFCV